MELEFCHGSRRENIEKIEKRVVRLKIIIFLYFGEKETSPVNNEDSQNKNSLVVTGYAQSFMESDSRERDARRTGYRYVFSKGLFMSYIV